MEKNFASIVFSDARKALKSSGTFTFFVIILLIGFHLIIYQNFIQVKININKAKEVIELFSQTSKNLKRSESDLSAKTDKMRQALNEVIEGTTLRIIRGLKKLDHAVWSELNSNLISENEFSNHPIQITSRLESQTTSRSESPELIRRDEIINNSLQTNSISEFFIEDKKLLKLLEEKKREEVYQYLQNYGYQRVIVPAFQEANETWIKEIRPNYIKALEESKEPLLKINDTSTNTRQLLVPVHNEITTILSKFENATISSPPNGSWWNTVEGKNSIMGGIKGEIWKHQSQSVLEDTIKQVGKILEANEVIMKEQTKKLDSIKKQFVDQQKQLQGLGGGFALIAVNLETLATMFPLFIGLLLGAGLHWNARAIKQINTSLNMMKPEDFERNILTIWLIDIILWAIPVDLNQKLSLHTSGKAFLEKMWVTTHSVVIGGVIIAWIFIAWNQAEGVTTIGYLSVLAAVAATLSGVVFLAKARILIINFLFNEERRNSSKT